MKIRFWNDVLNIACINLENVLQYVLQGGFMTTIRLPLDLEKNLKKIADNENLSKSEIIKKALENYVSNYYNKISPYELGKNFFGKYGSGESNNSKKYKQKLKDKIGDKINY